MKNPSRDALRRKRHERLRLRISGSAERPRLSVFRSAKYIYAQVIDDTHRAHPGRRLQPRERSRRRRRKVDIGALGRARRSPSGRRPPASAPWSSTGADTSITGGSARSPRAPARAASTCRARGDQHMARIDPSKLNLEEKVVQINRVAQGRPGRPPLQLQRGGGRRRRQRHRSAPGSARPARCPRRSARASRTRRST